LLTLRVPVSFAGGELLLLKIMASKKKLLFATGPPPTALFADVIGR
jgi:hypothetical protein